MNNIRPIKITDARKELVTSTACDLRIGNIDSPLYYHTYTSHNKASFISRHNKHIGSLNGRGVLPSSLVNNSWLSAPPSPALPVGSVLLSHHPLPSLFSWVLFTYRHDTKGTLRNRFPKRHRRFAFQTAKKEKSKPAKSGFPPFFSCCPANPPSVAHSPSSVRPHVTQQKGCSLV